MRTLFVYLIAVLCLAAPWLGQAEFAPTDDITAFQTMFAVKGPFRGPANPIRGVPGAALPREIEDVRGVLGANGHINITVRGLVLARHADVATDQHGINPNAYFRAVVSCLTVNDNGRPAVVNVGSGRAAANVLGDADIEDNLELPRPCVAPIVFVTNGRGAWLAATGR